MSEYRIHIDVDPYTRKFTYTSRDANGKKQDAKTLKLRNGDVVVWILDIALADPTFQIDFGLTNPFQRGCAVSFRGKDGYVVSSPVNLTPKYRFGRLFKYNVSLSNGWRDAASPCFVVPEPPDPGNAIVVQSRDPVPPKNTFYIQWNPAATEAAIKLTPANMVVQVDASQTTAMVSWQWDPAMPDPQPFTVTISTVVIPDVEGVVAATFPAASNTSARVTTTALDGTPVYVDGTVN